MGGGGVTAGGVPAGVALGGGGTGAPGLESVAPDESLDPHPTSKKPANRMSARDLTAIP